ncbi:outer membrane protein assembly factor BamC [Erwinia sp. OLTSP20]|uniref:outer membrane protein assembly factor BamC n=1 Tax=unclassified Erwinia TaxID=2622719 RepID=UPI000C18258A|nr:MULTISPECIES: outer membrane protein assembly factor BamC [unclassified Erwinia]PIJ51589.1 outer membrane protein assembly factor BamC [Erwinia sp. OAMSP11]PIJ68919.1 outer membrane protein assembly factor BamC [Erwinia sp. OLSSP12]PIJ83499.1 outer membrane protein assembly factor BamC [Erwinia sp. OLCASP19]PIJ83577.1 outer membrane protein assembly factor BamC [Erwinia sp. OLMDSP33]PIJ86332.1 outer membrane protein assembly factor BamC [Erwinia sp. OLMTSP26]
MAFTVKRSALFTVLGLSTAMLLAGCSNDQHYKRQVSDSDDYLKAPGLQDLHAPSGMILPIQNGDYDVPAVASKGPVGKKLDIRPPAQALALMNGTRTQFSGNTGMLMLDGVRNAGLWPQVVSVVKSHHYPIAEQQDASQSLTTDWVEWQRADEDQQYRGRYQISVQQQGYQQLLTVRLLQLQQAGKDVSSSAEVQRYTAQMLNVLSGELNKAEDARENAAANRSATQLDVQSGADDTGLPNLIVRAPFNTVWQRLPASLERIGMKVTDSNRSQGSLSVSYKSPGSSSWDQLAAKDPGLPNGKYKLQVGDLGNRSSLQVLDPKGHTLSQSQNDALVPVLQAAFSK